MRALEQLYEDSYQYRHTENRRRQFIRISGEKRVFPNDTTRSRRRGIAVCRPSVKPNSPPWCQRQRRFSDDRHCSRAAYYVTTETDLFRLLFARSKDVITELLQRIPIRVSGATRSRSVVAWGKRNVASTRITSPEAARPSASHCGPPRGQKNANSVYKTPNWHRSGRCLRADH
jgi:hypothetical protein